MRDVARAGEAYESAACALLTLAPKGAIEMANHLAAEWCGVAPEKLPGKPFQDLFVIGSKLFLQTQWWPLIQMQGSVAEVQLELARSDREAIPVLVNAVRRPDLRIEVAIFVAADRRKYERELLLARRRAEELLEVIALREAELKARARFAEQLIGIVSHDLRNPLNAILLGAELLRTTAPGPAAGTAKRIASSAQRATRLTSELLDFTQARLGGGLSMNRSDLDLHAVVHDAVEELRVAWPDHELLHERSGAGVVVADADRLMQVVGNLVSNAVVYGTKDRAITVTSVVGEDASLIRVHNHGRPVPRELRDAIFEPLQRGEEQVQRGSRSVGLGLFIVREIAQAHGGKARLDSSEEGGTTFEVVLPTTRD